MDKEIKALVAKHFEGEKEAREYVSAAGKVFGPPEMENLIKASLEGWWTEGKWTAEFEKKISEFLKIKHVLSCNSGSSANLLAFSALCSPTLGDRRIKPGGEVITVAAGFPTTVNAIIQNNCVPVFVDVGIPSYNIDVEQLEKAYSKKTEAVMIAHTLGNPFDIDAVVQFCKKHDLWLIEDNCDALGTKYRGKYTGGFGHVATLSFYPAHHITTAEGGAVLTNSTELFKIIRSIRDWGRHCFCPTGKDNSCGNRYNWQLGNLPHGYDHKYIYGEIGYNLKISDLHSAIGVAQVDRLDGFIKKRRENFDYLAHKMAEFSDYFILPEPTKYAEPSWFGYLLTIKEDKINRTEFLKHLEQNGIASRLLFGGNLTRQPFFTDNPDIKYRIVGDLINTDLITKNSFWIGLWPGLSKKDLHKTYQVIKQYISSH